MSSAGDSMAMTKITFVALVALLFGFSLSKSIAAESLMQSHSPMDYFFPDGALNSHYFLNGSNNQTSRAEQCRSATSQVWRFYLLTIP